MYHSVSVNMSSSSFWVCCDRQLSSVVMSYYAELCVLNTDTIHIVKESKNRMPYIMDEIPLHVCRL